MSYSVLLTEDAARDLADLYHHIAQRDGEARAEHVLSKIENAFSRLSETPERGAYPKELSALGIREYREIRFKPYRILYRVVKRKVYILLIIDGRRDMEALLQKRLLDG